MARHAWLDPSPFSFPGGPVGVLLLHGFTGAPTEMRPLGQFLAGHGYSVLCPLLPGHGTQPEDLNRVRWQDWVAVARAALAELNSRVEQVFVGGLSMGGLLALYLAAQEPSIAGLLLFAPALLVRDRRAPLSLLLRYFVSVMPKGEEGDLDLYDPEAFNRIWCYECYPVYGVSQVWFLQRQVRRRLGQVRQPILLFQGRRDGAIRPDNPQVLFDRVASTDKRLIWLERSGHNLLVDAQCQEVFEACLNWIKEHTR